MKRIHQFFRDSLDLSIAESRSAIVLFSIIFLTLLITFAVDRLLEKEASDIIIEEFGRIQLPPKKEKKPYYKTFNNNAEAEVSTVIKHFNFDPNTASESDLKTLGIGYLQVRMIINYRNKNGRFRFKEDLKRIYGFKPGTYSALEKYIQLPSKTDQKTAENNPVFTKDPVQQNPPAYKKTVKEINRFDLNTADTTQLKMLKGIGSILAARIVKFRDMLGGFVTVEQAGETYGVSPEAQTELLKMTFIKVPHKKININTAGADKLKHPYLKSFQAKAILTFRNQHGKFDSIEDLKKIQNLDEKVVAKIAPYLEF